MTGYILAALYTCKLVFYSLPSDISKDEFDKDPVLNRFDHQLKTYGIKTEYTMKPNFSWAVTNIDNIKQEFNLDKYIVLFPFCSAHLTHKKWPHYNELIELIKNKYGEQIKVVVAPGPSEIDDAKSINANNQNNRFEMYKSVSSALCLIL